MPEETWASFKLTPDDVLFFRDGRPSRMGVDHHIPSVFPPFPSTLYGAIRARRLVDQGVDLREVGQSIIEGLDFEVQKELGQWGGFGELRLRGPWLVRRLTKGGSYVDEILMPAPSDLALVLDEKPQSDDNEPPTILQVLRYRICEAGEGRIWSHPLSLMTPCVRNGAGWQRWDGITKGRKPGSVRPWYITSEGLKAWVVGGLPEPDDLVHSSELWLAESRVGVGLESGSRRHREGRLYTFGYVRLRQGVSIGFEVSNSGLRAGGVLRLGGDGKTVLLEEGPPLKLQQATMTGRKLVLCFLTPTISSMGAYPPYAVAGSDPMEVMLGDEMRCDLVAGCVLGTRACGGWDRSRGKGGEPKPLRPAIPEGTAFVLRSDTPESAGRVAKAVRGRCLAGPGEEELEQQGYGLSVVGSYE